MRGRRRRRTAAFHIYIGDLLKDNNFKLLDWQAQNLWIRLLLVMHENKPRGRLMVQGRPMTVEEIAKVCLMPVEPCAALLEQIEQLGVSSRVDGAIANRRMLRECADAARLSELGRAAVQVRWAKQRGQSGPSEGSVLGSDSRRNRYGMDTESDTDGIRKFIRNGYARGIRKAYGSIRKLSHIEPLEITHESPIFRYGIDTEVIRSMDTECIRTLIPRETRNKKQEAKKRERKSTPAVLPVPDLYRRFEQEVWVPYPSRDGKKLGKAEAWAKYQRLSPPDRTQLAVAVQHFARHPPAKAGVGVKDLHRWIQTGKGIEPWREWLDMGPGSNKPTPGSDQSWEGWEANDGQTQDQSSTYDIIPAPLPSSPGGETHRMAPGGSIAGDP